MHTKLALSLALLFLALSACAPVPQDIYVADAQAQSTLVWVRAFQTGTAQAQAGVAQAATLSAAKTQDSLHLVEAASTRRADSDKATSTAQAAATATARADAISTQSAAEALSASQTAWPPTAMALERTQNASARAEKVAALQSEWQGIMTPLKPVLAGFFWVALVLISVLGVVVAYRRFAPTLEQRMRTFITPDGEVVIALPAKVKVNVVQPKRNLGAGLVVGPDGIQVAGLPEIDGRPALPVQAGVVARLQAGQAFHYLPPGPPAEQVKEGFILKAFEGAEQAQPPETPHIEIVDPGEPEMAQIWEEVQKKLLLGSGEK